DLAKLLADIRSAIAKVDPAAPQKMDQGLDQFRGMTGLDLQNDVLAPLGEQWAIYTDPNIAGPISFGAVVINSLRDPAKAERSLRRSAQDRADDLSDVAAHLRLCGFRRPVRRARAGDADSAAGRSSRPSRPGRRNFVGRRQGLAQSRRQPVPRQPDARQRS